MTLLKLIRNDIYFQYRYGFYLLYGFFTAFYILILYFLPEQWQDKASVIVVISDPILIGLVFMGALVLFEKSERVLNSIAVSPITTTQYVISKSISVAIIGLLSAVVIVLSSREVQSVLTFVVGIGLGSMLFSLMGLAISTTVHTLNGFMIRIMPAMLFATFPVILYATDTWHWILELHPTTLIINLLNYNQGTITYSIIVLLLWNVALFVITNIRVAKMLANLNSVKL